MAACGLFAGGMAAASLSAGSAVGARSQGRNVTAAELARFQGSAPLRGLRLIHGAKGVHNIATGGSYNWAGFAGYKDTPQYYTSVVGTWTVPAVTCTSEHRLTSEWVGLDGAASTDPTVEQDGTTSECYKGTADYYSWYEMYPAGSVATSLKVKPGDVITASVVRSKTNYTLKLTDVTTSGSFTKAATCALATCLDESAEWITERPAYSIGIAPEAEFTKAIAFSHASATGGGKAGNISSQPGAVELACYDATGAYVIVATSSLGTTGASFTNTWKNSW
ncbi:MAG TPA: G1 family glutamic endopeptidase [Acidimicrobiales bacterium]|nr:G1 family glutamic endopeptidase [Acidimicrobiales bacterium]